MDFDNVTVVNFNSMVEVEKLLEQGVMARYEQSDDEGRKVSIMLPGFSPKCCRHYDVLSKDNDGEDELHTLRGAATN